MGLIGLLMDISLVVILVLVIIGGYSFIQENANNIDNYKSACENNGYTFENDISKCNVLVNFFKMCAVCYSIDKGVVTKYNYDSSLKALTRIPDGG